MKRSLIALLMSLLMLMSLLPVEAMAAELGEDTENIENTETIVETVSLPELEEQPAATATETETVEEPVIEEPAAEDPVIMEPAVEESVAEEPVIEAPVVEEPAIEEPLPADETGENEASDTEETPCAVVFRCEPETAEITVYSRQELERAEQEQAEPQPIEPESDKSYLLWPGDYVYCATAEGYEVAEKQPFVVADEETEKTVYVTLTAMEAETPETEAPMELADENTENDSILTEAGTEEISLEVVAAAMDGIVIDEINFPDAKFRSYVAGKCDTDHNGSLSSVEIANVTYMNVYNIADLTGIEYFTALETLYCDNNQLTSLDVSQNIALKCLHCYNNQLTNLDISGCTALTELWCDANQLTILDVSHTSALTKLYCYGNKLTSLDVSNCSYWIQVYADPNVTVIRRNSGTTSDSIFWAWAVTQYDINGDGELSQDELDAVTEIYCSGLGLTSLCGIDRFENLTYLDCSYNQLTSLDIHTNTELIGLSCENNQLTNIDISANTALQSLRCSDNLLTSLDVSMINTNDDGNAILFCDGNQLTSLDLSRWGKIYILSCEDNHLTHLNVRVDQLYVDSEFYCDRQTVAVDLEKKDGAYRLDFSTLVGSQNVNRVSVTSVTPADANYSMREGVLYSESKLTSLSYTYTICNSPNPNFSKTMDVTLALAVEVETTYEDGTYLEDGLVTKYADGTIDVSYTGLANYEGTWYYLTNGVQDNSFFGFTEFAGGKFLVANGTVATHINGLFQDPNDTAVWYFLSNGQAQTQYSGLALYDGSWFYLKDGILDTTFSGVVDYDGGKFLVGAGRIMSEVCGLCQDPITGTWYFFADGMVQDYTGEVEYGGSTFHITHGVLDA